MHSIHAATCPSLRHVPRHVPTPCRTATAPTPNPAPSSCLDDGRRLRQARGLDDDAVKLVPPLVLQGEGRGGSKWVEMQPTFEGRPPPRVLQAGGRPRRCEHHSPASALRCPAQHSSKGTTPPPTPTSSCSMPSLRTAQRHSSEANNPRLAAPLHRPPACASPSTQVVPHQLKPAMHAQAKKLPAPPQRPPASAACPPGRHARCSTGSRCSAS